MSEFYVIILKHVSKSHLSCKRGWQSSSNAVLPDGHPGTYPAFLMQTNEGDRWYRLPVFSVTLTRIHKSKRKQPQLQQSFKY